MNPITREEKYLDAILARGIGGGGTGFVVNATQTSTSPFTFSFDQTPQDVLDALADNTPVTMLVHFLDSTIYEAVLIECYSYPTFVIPQLQAHSTHAFRAEYDTGDDWRVYQGITLLPYDGSAHAYKHYGAVVDGDGFLGISPINYVMDFANMLSDLYTAAYSYMTDDEACFASALTGDMLDAAAYTIKEAIGAAEGGRSILAQHVFYGDDSYQVTHTLHDASDNACISIAGTISEIGSAAQTVNLISIECDMSAHYDNYDGGTADYGYVILHLKKYSAPVIA